MCSVTHASNRQSFSHAYCPRAVSARLSSPSPQCCKYMRDNHRYLYYALDAANSRNKKRTEAEVAKKASAIFGTNMQFSSEKFKLPKNATDQQLIEFSAYLGYTPIVLQKIKLEV